jgi:hypothetical protein
VATNSGGTTWECEGAKTPQFLIKIISINYNKSTVFFFGGFLLSQNGLSNKKCEGPNVFNEILVSQIRNV